MIYLKDFSTDSGVDLKGFGIEAAPTALTLSQIPGIGSHPRATTGDAVCVPTRPSWWHGCPWQCSCNLHVILFFTKVKMKKNFGFEGGSLGLAAIPEPVLGDAVIMKVGSQQT